MGHIHKTRLALIVLFIGHLSAVADVTEGCNYIRHDIYTEATMEVSDEDTEIVISTVDYYDGLGRKIQTLNRRAGANLVDIADYVEYNSMGLPCRKWIPMNGTNDGALTDIPSLVSSSVVNPYNNLEPFALYDYEAIPSPRLIETLEAGDNWHVHSGKNSIYGLAAGIRHTANVVKFLPTMNGVNHSGLWQPGELDMLETYDEDGKCKVMFTDKFGNLIMETDEFGKLTGTYYVYDQKNLLRYVIPPKLADILIAKGTGTTTADNDQDMAALAFIYKYDSRYRITSKKSPGSDVNRILYDINGLPVFTQDGNQADNGIWLYHAYDAMGRKICQSLVSSSQFDENNVGFINCLYSNNPLSSSLISADSILVRNYYDNYDLLMTESNDQSLGYITHEDYDTRYIYNHCSDRSAQGQLTGRMVRTMPLGNGSQTLYSSYYYDFKGNIIQSHEQNLLGGHDHYYYQLTFTGKPLKVMHVHTTADTTMTDVYQYTYDNMERLLTATVSHDGGAAVTLASNTYNSLGQLSGQSLGSHSNGVVDYSYNVRGWMQGISSSHFSQTLYYEQPVTGSTPCYNGNVSAVEWSALDAMAATTPTGHRYTFDYDGLNRLTAAHYGTTSSQDINGSLVFFNDRDYSTSYSYDLNGNIIALMRRGVTQQFPVFERTAWYYGQIDNLTLTYHGNQLRKVTDQCSDLTYAGAMDFKDGADASHEYQWDANGNMTRDANKRIWSIAYNELNLPREIQYYDGHIVRYTYAADGRKLRVKYLTSNVGVLDPSGSAAGTDGMPGSRFDVIPIDTIGPPGHKETTLLTMDYCGSHIYRNGELERTMNDYGYRADSTYYYYIKDYQGNVRAVITQNGVLKEINNYYPYGGLMGAATTGVQPNKYGAKELDRENGIDWYDFEARYQDPLLPIFTTQDALSGQTPGISPYTYCAGNPVRYIDLNGLSPIYSNNGVFLGVDDKGLMGEAIIMDERFFKDQGMPHDQALRNSYTGRVSPKAQKMIDNHYSKLKYRPDYDGFVTRKEGIAWAHSHRNALKRENADDNLYVDASKIDFTGLTTADFDEENVVVTKNLFKCNSLSATFLSLVYSLDSRKRDSMYALGQVELELLSRKEKTVRIINGYSTVYDWDYGDGTIRNALITLERFINSLDDSHGFRVYYYGFGKLRK